MGGKADLRRQHHVDAEPDLGRGVSDGREFGRVAHFASGLRLQHALPPASVKGRVLENWLGLAHGWLAARYRCGNSRRMAVSFYETPILNSPYACPTRHHVLNNEGQPLDEPPAQGRRRSELITPVPRAKKTKKTTQASLVLPDAADLTTADQEYNPTPIINEIRGHVATWRAIPNPKDWGVTPSTARLLQYWRTHAFEGPKPFFCQVEAVETAIWLAEVARSSPRYAHIRAHIREANKQANPDLSRIALKMATGSGKTTVMAMMIAWQAVNAVRAPASRLFSRGFLIVTPGITIKDRLRVLQPNDPENYYRTRELVPADMLPDIDRAKIVITNYHAFQRRETMDISKVGRSLLQGRGDAPVTIETEGQMLNRSMNELMGFSGSNGGIVVINDEAHHCYREKPGDPEVLTGEDLQEAKRNREAARLWISGLEATGRKLGIVTVYDLSATPFFLRGSGYTEGTLFPWTCSDFSLMDAIESGIVKLPRIPVADNMPNSETLTFRNLWDHIGKAMPKAGVKKGGKVDPATLPVKLENALIALYGHYEKVFAAWDSAGIGVPPVFIVVCNNTTTSQLVYEWIAGYERDSGDGERPRFENGRLAKFRNYDDNGGRLPRPTTLADRQRAAGKRRRAGQELPRHGRPGDRAVPSRAHHAHGCGRSRRHLGPGSVAGGNEHRRPQGPTGRADTLRRLRLHADRRLGHQHRHPHPGRARLRHPVAVRAGGGPRPAPAILYAEPGYRPVRPRIRRHPGHPVRLRGPAGGGQAASAQTFHPRARRLRACSAGDHLSLAWKATAATCRTTDCPLPSPRTAGCT